MNERLENYLNKIKNKKILIQGLGLNGGGVGSAVFFLENGFEVTITDLKTESELAESVSLLLDYSDKINYVLGEHNEEDFRNADIVVKGPGVPPKSKYVQIALENGAYITSDIEIFLQICPCEVFAVTGSKGKSSTVSAVYKIFKAQSENSFLGGNITISPLTFYKDLNNESLVILELSSWQLRDIKGKDFKFKGTAITNLLNDHQNYYSNMDDYLDDKKIIVQNQDKNDFCILPFNDYYLNEDKITSKSKFYYYSQNINSADFFYKDKWAYFNNGSKNVILFSRESIAVPGEHMKINLLLAAAFCYLAGIKIKNIQTGIKNFKGAPYRMELVKEYKGIKFYNDTTATIPDAAYNALKSFDDPIIWIAGGNDKNLDFSIIKEISDKPKKIFLLKGNGTDKMKKYLNRNDIEESNSLEYLFNKALESAECGDIIILSPGCTSFGLFQNEFHRGDVFNSLVNSL